MRNLVLLVLLFTLPMCAANGDLSSPAGAGSAEPFLSALPDGTLLMSWIEPSARGHAVRIATFEGKAWSGVRTVVERKDLFVNWADFPSVVSDSKGTLFAHWLQKSGTGTYAYDVRISSSTDRGATWRTARVLHTDGKQAEHGFVSMVPLAGSGVGVVWLDGRAMGGGGHDDDGDHGDMMLRYAEVDAKLNVRNETMLDARTCECCTTGMTRAGTSLVAAWRDRAADEVRDIAIARLEKGKWTAPKTLHPDGWKIAGCPVNGPQLDANGNAVTAAWFTAAKTPMVQVAFSNDAGVTFGRPVRIDSGSAIGRVDVLMLDSRSALVTWLEDTKPSARVMMRRVSADGSVAPPAVVAETSSARSSGFPRMARAKGGVYLAWTDAASKRIRVSRVQ